MKFRIRGLSEGNQIQTLKLDALDIEDARRQAEDKYLRPLSIKRLADSQLGLRSTKAFSLILFSQEMLALLEAGLSIVESIEALCEKEATSANRLVLERLLGHLHEGLRFSDALAMQPPHFPPLYIGIIQAAEGTSDLPLALTRYVDYQSRLDAVRNKVISASIYPAILLMVGGGVSLFLLGYVVPRFAIVYQGSGRSLPWLSQLLISWGQFIANHHQTFFATLALVIAVIILAIRHLIRSGHWQTLIMRLPGVGDRAHILELSRLYLTLGMLIEGGLAIRAALQMVQSAVSPTTRLALAEAREAISQGHPVSDSFEQHNLTTPIALRMLRVGERSGQLGTMLTRSALFYENETQRWLERFVKAVEPILMTAIGIVIGLIVVLLYMPIFDLAGSLQ